MSMSLEAEINSKKYSLKKVLSAAKDVKEINSVKIEYLKNMLSLCIQS